MSPTFKGSRRDCRGLTLIEVVIALVLISGFSAAVWAAYRAGFLTVYSEITRWRIKGESGEALARLSEDLRLAQSITAATATDLTLTRDTDDDGDDDSVQYAWSGVSGEPLNRTADVTVPVLKSVSALAFSYYDSGGNLLSFPVTAGQVRLVSVEFTVFGEDETVKLPAKIRLRNL